MVGGFKVVRRFLHKLFCPFYYHFMTKNLLSNGQLLCLSRYSIIDIVEMTVVNGKFLLNGRKRSNSTRFFIVHILTSVPIPANMFFSWCLPNAYQCNPAECPPRGECFRRLRPKAVNISAPAHFRLSTHLLLAIAFLFSIFVDLSAARRI